MADVTNYTTMDLANMILTEKTNKITPENIRHDVQIFDIVGTYKGDTGASYSPTVLAPFTGIGMNTYNSYTETYIRYEGRNLDIFDVEHLDTSNVKKLSYTFYHCDDLNTLRGLTNWDVSNVTEMRKTFGSGYNLTSVQEVGNWNTNNCTYYDNVFKYLHNVDITPITNWDISNAYVNSFISGHSHYDLSGFANRDYVNMRINTLLSFSNQQNLDNMYNCNFYNCTMNQMFYFGNVPSLPEISTWYFKNCNISNLCRSQPKNFRPEFTMNGNNMNLYYMWGSDNGYSYTPNMISTGNYNIDNVHATNMFANASKIADVENITFTHARCLNCMFYNCSNITSINNMQITLETPNGHSDYYYFGNISYMFYNCTNLKDMTCIENWKYIDNVSTGDSAPINIMQMFYNCRNLSNNSLYAICNFFYNISPYMNNRYQKNLMSSNSYSPFYYTNINLRNVLSEDMINKMTSRGFTL